MDYGVLFILCGIALAGLGLYLDDDARRALHERLGSFGRGPMVALRSGTRWYPFAPRAEEVRFSDWTALAWINRWGGHADLCSVAEHSFRVAWLLRRQGCSAWTQLRGALHDVAEVYPPGDIAAPVLRGPWLVTWGLRWMKRRAEQAVAERMCMPWRLPEVVLQADRVALTTEAYWRMPHEVFGRPSAPASQPERWAPEYAAWRWWMLVGELAAQSAADLRRERIEAAEHHAVPRPDLVARIRALEELAVAAGREAARFAVFERRAAA